MSWRSALSHPVRCAAGRTASYRWAAPASQLKASAVTGGQAEDELLRLVASAERQPEHPLGEAIVRGDEERELALAGPQQFESVTGKGLRASVDGNEVLVGTRALLSEAGI